MIQQEISAKEAAAKVKAAVDVETDPSSVEGTLVSDLDPSLRDPRSHYCIIEA